MACAQEPSLPRATVGRCALFPPDHIWNTPVDALPVDARSTKYVASIGAELPFHPDFGGITRAGIWTGIPFVDVPGSQPRVPVVFRATAESDPGPYPIPVNAPIEGGPLKQGGDRHVLVLDREGCRLYEVFNAFPEPDGSWRASSGAVFDLRGYRLRPAGWTSSDAAGLPILPGLARYEELASGEIGHALRFTAPRTRRAYVWPARHFASRSNDPALPPMGQRFRLRGDFDETGFSPEARVFLRALKRYGMMLADNGGAWYLSGVPDTRWRGSLLQELRRLRGKDFEAVSVERLQINPDSGQARQPAGAGQ